MFILADEYFKVIGLSERAWRSDPKRGLSLRSSARKGHVQARVSFLATRPSHELSIYFVNWLVEVRVLIPKKRTVTRTVLFFGAAKRT